MKLAKVKLDVRKVAEEMIGDKVPATAKFVTVYTQHDDMYLVFEDESFEEARLGWIPVYE